MNKAAMSKAAMNEATLNEATSNRPPARTRLTTRSAERRRAAVAGGGLLLVAAVSAVAAIKAVSDQSPPPVQAVPGMSDSELRTAKITREVFGEGCSQQTFDNQTGRMVNSSQPCDPIVYDKNGVPVPVGTIHRLDAISKSFPGH